MALKSVYDEIRSAQIRAGEDAVIANLKRMEGEFKFAPVLSSPLDYTEHISDRNYYPSKEIADPDNEDPMIIPLRLSTYGYIVDYFKNNIKGFVPSNYAIGTREVTA